MSSLYRVRVLHGRKHLLIKVKTSCRWSDPVSEEGCPSFADDTRGLGLSLITRCRALHFYLSSGLTEENSNYCSAYVFNVSVMGRQLTSPPEEGCRTARGHW